MPQRKVKKRKVKQSKEKKNKEKASARLHGMSKTAYAGAGTARSAQRSGSTPDRLRDGVI